MSDPMSDGAKTGPYGCKCQTLAHKLNGDGCDECNPALALEHAQGTIDELEAELRGMQDTLTEALKVAGEALEADVKAEDAFKEYIDYCRRCSEPKASEDHEKLDQGRYDQLEQASNAATQHARSRRDDALAALERLKSKTV